MKRAVVDQMARRLMGCALRIIPPDDDEWARCRPSVRAFYRKLARFVITEIGTQAPR